MKLEMVGNAWRMVFDLASAASMVGVIVLFAAMGYASLRLLRKQPDCEHKAEMLWGAQWFWALLAGLIAFMHLVVYLGVTLTAYLLSFQTGARSVFYIGFILLYRFLPWQGEGLFASSVGFLAWAKRKPLDWPSALAKLERQHRSWWWRWGLILGVALMAGLNAYMICRYTYPLERDLVEFDRQDKIAAAVEKQLGSPAVVKVTAGGPPSFENHIIWVKVSDQTTAEDAATLVEQTKRALAAQELPEVWEIRVNSRDKGRLATGLYDPHAPAPSE